ncbi:MAG: methylmalonyl Co-A mutase-associated GTPase MeaB [Acidimicrobiia bacterium]
MPTEIGALVAGLRARDRSAIAKSISVMEQGGPDAAALSAAIFPNTGSARVLGLTGAPGAGKSTLTDQLIRCARGEGDEIGVLAIDPTSPFTGGAILGDRVRMQNHATDDGVFIRSMATRGHLGGLALAVPQAVRVLDAAQKPWVLIETVGVGQVEVEIAGTADTTIVVVTPGWGDGVQANKAGLMEIADIFVVNKADRPGARETVRDLEQMLDLALEIDRTPGWRPPIVETVATSGDGIDALWKAIAAHSAHLEAHGDLARRRRARLAAELTSLVFAEVARDVAERCRGERFDALVDQLESRIISPQVAARTVLDT